MPSRSSNVAGALLALLTLAAGLAQNPVLANDPLGLTGMIGGLTGAVNPGGGSNALSGALGILPNMMNSATSLVGGITNPVLGALGSVGGQGGGAIGNVLQSTLGGIGTLTGGDGIVANGMRLATGAVSGLSTGIGTGIGGLSANYPMASAASGASRSGLAGAAGAAASASGSAATSASSSSSASTFSSQKRNNFKREAIAEGAMFAGNQQRLASEMMLNSNMQNVALAQGAQAAAETTGMMAASQANAIMTAGAAGAQAGTALATNAALNQGAESMAAGQAAYMTANAALAEGRQALAAEAMKSAQAESAAAGADMVANGAINSRSASLASNAYRQAKLASAHDRVNIAGTIQNSARISDAAIATHDAATKAEDSLLGSELAVDSASTVLDSDAAYIPPVTNSLLRSLPYGRLGLRNIIPKPLAHPSVMLPDVWLNGAPVNYLNVPLRMLPYGMGPAASVGSLMANQAALATGSVINGQPFVANNGMLLNGLVFDPAYAYLTAASVNGAVGSNLIPILANGQIEAQDELALANMYNVQQMNGAGMASTYQGYGRINPVPMITGSVSDINLMPTTTIGTTYPIGSALVIEPRDSYFQDYTDNASSRQNFDERQQ